MTILGITEYSSAHGGPNYYLYRVFEQQPCNISSHLLPPGAYERKYQGLRPPKAANDGCNQV
jgi:hypothetical protein